MADDDRFRPIVCCQFLHQRIANNRQESLALQRRLSGESGQGQHPGLVAQVMQAARQVVPDAARAGKTRNHVDGPALAPDLHVERRRFGLGSDGKSHDDCK